MDAVRFDAREGRVAIDLGTLAGGERLHGARIGYEPSPGAGVRSCAIVPGPYPDALLGTSFWEWNEAVLYGNVKRSGPGGTVFWDLHASGMHRHRGDVTIRVELLLEGGIRTLVLSVRLEPSHAVYLGAVDQVPAEPEGWKAQEGAVAFQGQSCAKALEFHPGLEGRYTVWLGIRSGSFMGMVELLGEGIAYPVAVNNYGATIPELDTKANKEILWKTVRLERESVITLRPHPAAMEHAERYAFGRLAYLRLVPAGRETTERAGASRLRWGERKLALYFEPYSWAYVYGLTDREGVRGVLRLFREMGADEIHTQVIRFGSRSLHHGRVAERHVEGRLQGDDGTYSDRPTEMVRSIDVLKESIEACRELGMVHFANAGLTNCYPGSGLEDRISREHPEWRRGHLLRYDRQETVAYAAAIMAEFVEWGSDGVSLDCMRYPYHHTEEELTALVRAMASRMRAAADRRVPFTVRIPAGDVVYWRAFLALAREGIVSCVIPSTLYPRKPLYSLAPYRAFKDAGCAVYGRIDGWKENLEGNGATALMPADIREDVQRFFREGADGVFVYQADGHLANPFTRGALKLRSATPLVGRPRSSP